VSPLVAASDALVVDTSDRGVEEVITELMTRIGERIRVPSRCESGQRDLE
jgi:cytidylate kinase